MAIWSKSQSDVGVKQLGIKRFAELLRDAQPRRAVLFGCELADGHTQANVEISIVKHYASQMKTASVRELRQNFGGLLAWLEEGQEIQITMRRRVVARLVPDGRNIVAKVRMPDFAARLKKLHGKKVIGAQEAQAILDENKGEF